MELPCPVRPPTVGRTSSRVEACNCAALYQHCSHAHVYSLLAGHAGSLMHVCACCHCSGASAVRTTSCFPTASFSSGAGSITLRHSIGTALAQACSMAGIIKPSGGGSCSSPERVDRNRKVFFAGTRNPRGTLQRRPTAPSQTTRYVAAPLSAANKRSNRLRASSACQPCRPASHACTLTKERLCNGLARWC